MNMHTKPFNTLPAACFSQCSHRFPGKSTG